MPLFARVVKHLWGVEPHQIYVTDNQPLVRWLNNKRTDSDPEWQGKLEYVEERVRERCADVIWVPTKEKRAGQTHQIRAGHRCAPQMLSLIVYTSQQPVTLSCTVTVTQLHFVCLSE